MCYTCAVFIKNMWVKLLDSIRFQDTYFFAVAERSKEEKRMRAQKAPSANQWSDTVQ